MHTMYISDIERSHLSLMREGRFHFYCQVQLKVKICTTESITLKDTKQRSHISDNLKLKDIDLITTYTAL